MIDSTADNVNLVPKTIIFQFDAKLLEKLKYISSLLQVEPIVRVK
jgi:hypothetical protein